MSEYKTSSSVLLCLERALNLILCCLPDKRMAVNYVELVLNGPQFFSFFSD